MSSKLSMFNGGTTTINNIPKHIQHVSTTTRSILLCGSPGIGKSAKVYEFAKENDYLIFTFTGGLVTRSGLYGTEFINTIDASCIHYVAEWYRRAMESNKKVILFLDDLANANPQEMMILQQILGDRKLGNYDLPVDKFLIIAATNMQKHNSNVYNISEAILTRLCVIEVILNSDEFLHMAESKVHPAVYSFLLHRIWAISDDADYLEKVGVPSDVTSYGVNSSAGSTVHPRPRTWTGVSDILYGNDAKYILDGDNISFFETTIAGLVGKAIATLFVKSLHTTLNIPSIQFLVDNVDTDVNYVDHVSTNYEAVTATVFNVYQALIRQFDLFREGVNNGTYVYESGTKGLHVYTCKPLTDLFKVLNKIKESEFGEGINTAVIVCNLFDQIKTQDKDNVRYISGLIREVPFFREYMNNQSDIRNMLRN